MESKITLDLQDAEIILAGALDAASAKGLHVSIAVTDEAGRLLAFKRHSAARAHTIELALEKSRTAAIVGVSTAEIALGGRSSVQPGGIPVLINGSCAGGIGVSGAPTDEDVALADAGCWALHLTNKIK